MKHQLFRHSIFRQTQVLKLWTQPIPFEVLNHNNPCWFVWHMPICSYNKGSKSKSFWFRLHLSFFLKESPHIGILILFSGKPTMNQWDQWRGICLQAGLKVEDIDIYEINEAFASQATMSVDHLKIPMEKVGWGMETMPMPLEFSDEWISGG